MGIDDSAVDKINQTTSQPAPSGAAAAVGGSVGDFEKGMLGGAASMVNGAQGMLSSAQSGQLKFDPNTGQSLIKTLNQHIDDLNELDLDLERDVRKFKLGMTPGGQAVSNFNQEVTATGANAFLTAHQQFKQSLQTCVQAIQIAMDNYNKTEGDNAKSFKPKD